MSEGPAELDGWGKKEGREKGGRGEGGGDERERGIVPVPLLLPVVEGKEGGGGRLCPGTQALPPMRPLPAYLINTQWR